MLIIDYLAEM